MTCALWCVKLLQKNSELHNASDCLLNLILFCDFIHIPLTSDTKIDLSELVNGTSLQKWKEVKKSSPEEDAQDVGYEQHKTDSGGEALCVAALLDLLVLRHVGQGPSEHHDAGGQPGEQRPWALQVLLLQDHLCIHHTERSSGPSTALKFAPWRRKGNRINNHIWCISRLDY